MLSTPGNTMNRPLENILSPLLPPLGIDVDQRVEFARFNRRSYPMLLVLRVDDLVDPNDCEHPTEYLARFPFFGLVLVLCDAFLAEVAVEKEESLCCCFLEKGDV